MEKLCAPVRDEKIKELQNNTDVVETFKGILEVNMINEFQLATEKNYDNNLCLSFRLWI